MIEIKEKHKIYILGSIFAIAGLILYYSLLLKPLFTGFVTINKEYRIVSDRVKKAQALIKNEDGIQKQHDSIGKQAGYLERRLPGQDQISSLLEDFSKIAESSGVKILRIKPIEETVSSSKQKVKSAAYTEFPILIEARAGYHQFGMFVNKLEIMDRFIRITDLNITGNDKDHRHHDIKMRIITYVLL